MKQMTIAGSGSDSILTAAVAPVSATILTLAALVGSIMTEAAAPKLIIVDLARRKVGTLDDVSGKALTLKTAVVTAAGGGESELELNIVDDTKTSGEWTTDDSTAAGDILTPLGTAPARSPFDDELNGLIGYSKPSKSVSGIVGALEDSSLALAARSTPVVDSGWVIISQVDKTLFFVRFATPTSVADFAAIGTTGVVPTAVFTGTVLASGSGSGGAYGI